MKIQYGVLTRDKDVDSKGYIYRVQWYDTLQQAYSKWIANEMRGDIVKSLRVQVVEQK